MEGKTVSIAPVGGSSVPVQLLQALSGGNEAAEPKGVPDNDGDADDAPQAMTPPPAPPGTGRVVDKQA